MNVEPIISVVIPIYNVEKYLVECLSSVCNQSYRNLDIVLVNDGSTDECLTICNEYKKKDSRIQLVDKQNGGLSDARNAGIDVAKGEYICFVDSDDFIDCNMIQLLYKAIEEADADISICNYYSYVDRDTVSVQLGLLEGHVWDEKEFWDVFVNNRSLVVVWNRLYKKQLFEKIRFQKGKLHEDNFIIHLLMNKASKIVYIPECLYYYRIRQGSIMKQRYSVRNMDGIEASLKRCEYFLENEWGGLIDRELKYLFLKYRIAYERLNMSIKVNKQRYKELKSMFSKLFMRIPRKYIKIKHFPFFWYLAKIDFHVKLPISKLFVK